MKPDIPSHPPHPSPLLTKSRDGAPHHTDPFTTRNWPRRNQPENSTHKKCHLFFHLFLLQGGASSPLLWSLPYILHSRTSPRTRPPRKFPFPSPLPYYTEFKYVYVSWLPPLSPSSARNNLNYVKGSTPFLPFSSYPAGKS